MINWGRRGEEGGERNTIVTGLQSRDFTVGKSDVILSEDAKNISRSQFL